MVRPDRQSFRALARHGQAIPLVREVLADLDTPVSLFLKVDDGATSFLLESVEGPEERGRFSFIGVGVRATFRCRAGQVEIRHGHERERITLAPDHRSDPLEHLRTLLERLRPAEIPDLPRFSGGAVGYLSYDWVRYVERLPDLNPDPLGLPDCFFNFPEVLLVHDRKRGRLSILTVIEIEARADPESAYDEGLARIEGIVEKLAQPVSAMPVGPARPLEVSSSLTRERYHQIVERAKEYIRAGDIFQVVPSQRFSMPLRTDPIQIYRWLRVINPSPYMFFMRCDDHIVLGASPEILVRLDGREINLRPIAGTRPRGANAEEDLANERELLADPKELAEHIMLVDLGRNDVGRVAEIGSVRVDELRIIERYSHVMHIVSNVRGKLRSDCDAIDLLRASFPAGTLSGAPKVRAMEIIEEFESQRRGLYGGSVGYIDQFGSMDMCIAIRTLLIKDGMIHVQAGGGVVADSDPEREYQETLDKAGAVMKAIELAGGAEPA